MLRVLSLSESLSLSLGGVDFKEMDAKAMDAEVGRINEEGKNLGKMGAEPFNEEGKNLGNMDSEGGEFNEEDKNLGDKNDDDEDSDSDDSLGDVISDEDLICRSEARNIFEHPNFWSVSSRLEGEDLLVEHFENIIKILKRENITSVDADEFTNVVKQVLGNDAFVGELYKELEDMCCRAMMAGRLRRTQHRVDKKETTEERMGLIRSDTGFARVSAGGNREFIIRGGMSIILAYCVSVKELTEIVTRCRDDEQLRIKYGLTSYLEI